MNAVVRVNPVHVLASGRTYRRIVHLLLGAVVLLPYLALGWLLAQAARAGTAVVAVVLLGALALGVGVAIALVPGVRALEVSAARALLGTTGLPDPAPDAETAWPGRLRAAAWLLVSMVVGGLAGLAILVVVPVAVGLVVAPWQSQPPVPTGAAGWWAPLVGILLLPALVLILAAGGAWAARAAPRFLGPAPAERLAGELEAARARADRLAERARLARELHDSVGHALTVTTLQAGAAGQLLDTDPAFVRRALAAIEETGRTALDELDHVLGLLREETGGETAPRDLRALDALVEGARSAGVEVDLHRDGVLDGVPTVVSREVYRLVQEALTNSLRHAGPVPVTIRLATRGDDLHLTVDNPLPPGRRSRRRGGGSGLRGTAERAALLGGELTAGPVGRMWRLEARLPGGAG